MNERATCIIADDHAPVRDGLRLRLEQDGYVRVVGEAHSGEAALRMLRELQPELALLEQLMPTLDACDVTERARGEHIPTRVIVMSRFTEPSLLDRAFAAGARGYVAKDAPTDVFTEALRRVHAGDRYIDPSLAGMYQSTRRTSLTPREVEILSHMADGLSNTAIARRLQVTQETVKSHVSNILAKLDAESRTEAVAIALRRSIIQ